MKLIPLSKNSKKHAGKYFAKVDDEDYDFLMQFSWTLAIPLPDERYVYAKTAKYIGKIDGKNKYKETKMHRLIMKAPKEMAVDHIDHDRLNNQKSNLRLCTHAQNYKNRSSKVGSTSKYLGVFLRVIKRKGRFGYTEVRHWVASLSVKIENKKRTIRLGRFECSEEGEKMAAKAYNEGAIKYHGEFSNLNVIE